MELEIKRFDHSTGIKLTARPYVVLCANGPSYLSKKAVDLLGLKDLDTVALYYNTDFTKLFFVNDDECGAQIRKNSGLWRFCDTKAVKKIFEALNITVKQVHLPLGSTIEIISEKKALFIIPKPYNEK